MYYFDLFTTRECNLHCNYCTQPKIAGKMASYEISQLRRYIMDFEGGKCIVFYGGEPLLNLEFIREVMNCFSLDHIHFGIQTNGVLLGRLSEEEAALFDMIMVSIDGYEILHDRYRGRGTYRQIMDNVRRLRGLTKIYARLTISDAAQYADYSIISLISCFDGIYWQTCDKEYPTDACRQFSERYNDQIRRTIDFWYAHLREGVVLSLPTFNLLYRDLTLHKKYDKVRCGANSTHFTVDTEGDIFPCVDSVFEPGFCIGNISECGSKRRHPYPTHCSVCQRCAKCPAQDICGGACWMDINSREINSGYTTVKCSNILAIIKHLQSYVDETGGKYVPLIEKDMETHTLFYNYCEKIP